MKKTKFWIFANDEHTAKLCYETKRTALRDSMETDCILSTLKQGLLRIWTEHSMILQKMKWPCREGYSVHKFSKGPIGSQWRYEQFWVLPTVYGQFWVFHPFIQRSLVKVLNLERIMIAVILIFLTNFDQFWVFRPFIQKSLVKVLNQF